MYFDFWEIIATLAPFVIFAAIIGVFIWFVVSLVLYAKYDGDDTAHRKKLRFRLMLSGGFWLMSIISIVALILVFIMAMAHM